MNVSKPSIGGVYVSPKGLEKLKNDGYWGQEKLEMLKEVAQNKEESVNDFILDDNGNFNIRNEEYGTFRPANPPNAEARGKTFTCKILNKNGEIRGFYMPMKDAQSAEALERNFLGGTSVPGGVVALYNAMNATAAYEKEQQSLQAQKNQQLCDDILSQTKPYTDD